MDSIYFSKENFKRIYKILYTNFKKNFKFSIKRRPGYKQKIIDIMKFVYSNRHTYDIPDDLSEENKSIYLTQKLINLIIFYESKNHIVKDDNEQMEKDGVISHNKINSLRPQIVSNKDNSSIENNLNALLESRKPITREQPKIDFTMNNPDFDNVNIQDKYSEITKERETEYDNFSRPPITETEMKEDEKNVFEHMNMDPDNVDLDNVLGDYQLMSNSVDSDRGLRLQNVYSNLESVSEIKELVSGESPESNELINHNKVIDNNIIIENIQKTNNKNKSYIKYHSIVINCAAKDDPNKPRVIEFKDISDIGGATLEQRLENTNGGALIRDGWSNVVSTEIKRIIIPKQDNLPYLFLTTDSLPSNITPSENLPQNIFAILYHDKSSAHYSHYVNIDEHIQKFEKPSEVFMNKIRLNIETHQAGTATWQTPVDSIHETVCKVFLNIGIKVDHKFDN